MGAFRDAIRTHLDTILGNELNPFFGALQAALGDANVAARYYLNIGLPLLVQVGTRPFDSLTCVFVSAATAAAGTTLIAGAFRSWMRIQWSGSTAQAAAMNAVIPALAITNDAQRSPAAQRQMLSEDEHQPPNTGAGISPMPEYHNHIVTRP